MKVITIAAAIFLAFGAQAQILGNTTRTDSMGTAQFGLSNEAHYIFCDKDDCPERTLKHIDIRESLKISAIPIEPLQINVPSISRVQYEEKEEFIIEESKPKKTNPKVKYKKRIKRSNSC